MKKRENADEVLIALRKITRAIDLHSKDLVKKCGLTGPQLSILKELEDFPEIMISELAKKLSLSNATVTGIIERMITKNLVTKERSRVDKRQVLVQPTPLGRDILKKAPPLLQDRFLKTFHLLQDWEQSLILSCLQRVGHMMESGEIDELLF